MCQPYIESATALSDLRREWAIFWGGGPFLWFWRKKIITNSYFIICFLFICQNVGNFKGFLLVGLY